MATLEINETTTVITEYGSIYYNNGITCDVTLVNEKLKFHKFRSEDGKRKFVYILPENIEKLKYTHFCDIYKLYGNLTTIEQLENFDMFDNLYEVSDRFVFKKDGTLMSTVMNMDNVYVSNYANVETSKAECEAMIANIDPEYIVDYKISTIPLYNQNEKCDDHYSIDINVLLPDDLFVKLYDETEYELQLTILKHLGIYKQSND
jgi:hypothetical protein